MKILKYLKQAGDELYQVAMSYNEANEEIAKSEAYNGEYTIDDAAEEV